MARDPFVENRFQSRLVGHPERAVGAPQLHVFQLPALVVRLAGVEPDIQPLDLPLPQLAGCFSAALLLPSANVLRRCSRQGLRCAVLSGERHWQRQEMEDAECCENQAAAKAQARIKLNAPYHRD